MPGRRYWCQCKQSRPFDFTAHFPDDIWQSGKLARKVIGIHFRGKLIPQLFLLNVQEDIMHPKKAIFRHTLDSPDQFRTEVFWWRAHRYHDVAWLHLQSESRKFPHFKFSTLLKYPPPSVFRYPPSTIRHPSSARNRAPDDPAGVRFVDLRERIPDFAIAWKKRHSGLAL